MTRADELRATDLAYDGPVIRATIVGVLVGTLAACKPGPPPAQQQPEPEVDAVEPACDSAACWRERAAAAEQLGLLDVASGHRGQAFALDRRPELLREWLDGLQRHGELRRAREILQKVRVEAERDGAAALLASISDYTVPESPPPASLTPTPIHERLRDDYKKELAAALLAAPVAPEPARLADAISTLDPGASDPALRDRLRRARARARIGFHEAGADLRMVPVETWMTTGLTWREGQVVIHHNLAVIDEPGVRMGMVTVGPPGPTPPTRRLFFAAPAGATALTSDGAALLRSEGLRVLEQDLRTGDARPAGALAERIGKIVSVGAGADRHVLAADARGAKLFDAEARVVDTFVLRGTTPTITRVYYEEEGTRHRNILDDAPSWPTALAITADRKLVAIGASDSQVHVFDRTSGKQQLLKFAWDYVERRHMGGNPDLNAPLALHLDATGEHLLAVHSHGDVIRWQTRTGRSLLHVPGACSEAEAEAVDNRYAGPGDPRKPPTPETRSACGRATVAAISPDGGLIATAGIHGLRIRDANGTGVALLVDNDLPDGHLEFAPDNSLALLDLYGALAVWRRDQQLARERPPAEAGPVSPTLSRRGALLQFALGRRAIVWDLLQRRPLALAVDPSDTLLALADDGERAVVRSGGHVELRELAAREPLLRLPIAADVAATAQFADSGHVLVDMSGKTRELTLIGPEGRGKPIPVSTDAYQLELSDDGRWLATLGNGVPLQVWSARTDKLEHTLDADVRWLSFARDGSYVAWLAQPERGKPVVQARLQRLAAGPTPAPLQLAGWPQFITTTPDGSELLILLESGRLVRWDHARGTHREFADIGLIGAQSVQLAEDGKTLLLAGFRGVDIRANDAQLTPLASVHALLTGGWLAISRAGAIDGSADAVDSLVTRVTRGDETLVFDGKLGWDGAHVEGVVARALAGEDVRPPVLVRAPVK